MLYRLCLWWRSRFGKTPKIRGDAILEREIAKGLFIQTRVSDYMRTHNMALGELLNGITHPVTRKYVRKQYLAELAYYMRSQIKHKHKTLKNKWEKPVDVEAFDRAAVEYICLGGRLTDVLDNTYLPDEMYATASESVCRDIIRPKLERERSDAEFLKRARRRLRINENPDYVQ